MTLCCGCQRCLSVGDCKVAVPFPDGTSRVYCHDCAPRLMGVRERFPEIGDAQVLLNAIAAGPVRRRRPMTLREVRDATS